MIKKKYSELKEFTSAQMATLKKEYEPMRGKTISIPNVNKMNTMLDKFSKDILTKLANADIPFISTGAASKLVMKHGMKFTDFKLNMSEADELQCEACWVGYKQVGMKKKGDRQVPNCVKEEDLKEMIGEINDLRGSLSDAQLERMKQDWKNKSASAMTSSIKQTIMNMDAPTRAALKAADINHISKFANSTLEEVEIEESRMDDIFIMSDEGSTPEEIAKEMNLPLKIVKSVLKMMDEDLDNDDKETIKPIIKQLQKSVKAHDKQAKQLKKDIADEKDLEEADLSKSQVKMVHKKADDMPKTDFIKRYGKDGDAVRYATATNMVKKKLGIEEEEFVPEQTQSKGEEVMNESYKDKFNATMKKFGINSLGDLKSDEEKKKFFTAVDKAHVAKNEELEEELSAAQKKLPAGLQKAIMKKQGDSKDEMASGTMNAQYEMMKKEMMKKMEMLKAEKDPSKMEMMKKEMMTAMKKMPEMMKKEMMKKMEMAMKEGFSSDAQRKAAFASGYKEKGKKKDEMMKMKKEEDAYDNERFIIIDGKAKKDDENTPDKKDHVYAPDAKTALQLHKQGKKVYRESIDPSCPICEGEACQCAQAPSDTETVSEKHVPTHNQDEMMATMKMKQETAKKEMMNAMKIAAMRMPIKATYGKMNAMKTGDDDMTPMNNMKLNAMIKDPHKSNGDKPMKDMNATYMRADVRADIKNNGGADMAQVKDSPKMQEPMKKINAMYGNKNESNKYHITKPGSIQDIVAQMHQTESQEINVKGKEIDKMIGDYLKKGGTIKKLPPALAKGMKSSNPVDITTPAKKGMITMGEVREFITTYNLHFLTNYRAEDFVEKKSVTEARYEVEGTTGYKGIGGEDQFSMVINANSEKDAEDKAYDALEKARNQRKIGPGGGGNLEYTEVEFVQKTNAKLSEPETSRGY